MVLAIVIQSYRLIGDEKVFLCLRRWNRLTARTMSADRVNPVEMLPKFFAPFTST